MVMLNLASDDPRKRAMQAPRITPIQAPRAVAPPQQEEGIASRFAQAAMNRGIDTAAQGSVDLAKKYGAPMLQKGMSAMTAAAPTTTQAAALQTAGTGMAPGMAQAILGSGSATAPLVGKAAGATAASSLPAAGMMSQLGAAGTAAMASPAAPIIGGLLAMKMLGFFSGGGHVGPLAKAQYKSAGGEVMTMSYGGPLTKGA